ncbi:MAG: CooT family nickel-binding protein [Lachnospiraceae bacterium]|nr:CooT family nickel-binding protein [Lachnospiraceae bacterium]
MCLSNVFLVSDDSEELVCEYASSVDVSGNEIRLTDVIGQEITVTGTILSVDLIRNQIKVKAG